MGKTYQDYLKRMIKRNRDLRNDENKITITARELKRIMYKSYMQALVDNGIDVVAEEDKWILSQWNRMKSLLEALK